MAQHRVKHWIAAGAVLLTLAATPSALAITNDVSPQTVVTNHESAPLLVIGEPTAGQIVQNFSLAFSWLWQSMQAATSPPPTAGGSAPTPDSTILPPQPYASGGDDASGPWPRL
ncbi:MAG: hypothetical protein U0V87_14740 [Acidobacteriota bacterium]